MRMLRTAPTNYLLTAAVGGLLWTVLAVGLGGYLGDRVSLQERTTEDFLALYRMTLGVVLVLSLANCFYWYFWGSRPRAAVDLAGARRVWTGSLLGEMALSAAALGVLAVLLQAEGLALVDYVLIFATLALHTFLFFWAMTWFASPPPVEYIPLGRR